MASRALPHRPTCQSGLHLAQTSSFDPSSLVRTSPPTTAFRSASDPTRSHPRWHSGVPDIPDMAYTQPSGKLYSQYDEQTRRALTETMASQNPGQLADFVAYTEPPFFFIDEYSATRVLLDVDRDTSRSVFYSLLELVSSDIATQVKNAISPPRRRTNAANAPRQRFHFYDGLYLYRFTTNLPGPEGRRVVASTTWKTITPRSYHLLFEGPGDDAESGFFVEIQHILQRFRLFGPRCAPAPLPPPPAPPRVPVSPPTYQQQGLVVWHLASQPPSAVEVPATNKGAPAALHPAPAATFLRRLDDLERRPAPVLAHAMAPCSPPPPRSPSPAPTRPIVRMPPVPASAAFNDPFPLPGPAALAVAPVLTGLARGVVDSAALGWYRREEELRTSGLLRFGRAEGIESLDVWRGW